MILNSKTWGIWAKNINHDILTISKKRNKSRIRQFVTSIVLCVLTGNYLKSGCRKAMVKGSEMVIFLVIPAAFVHLASTLFMFGSVSDRQTPCRHPGLRHVPPTTSSPVRGGEGISVWRFSASRQKHVTVHCLWTGHANGTRKHRWVSIHNNRRTDMHVSRPPSGTPSL